MHSLISNGDNIAQEFARLLGNSLDIKKFANADATAEDAAVDAAAVAVAHDGESDNEEEDGAEDEAADNIFSENDVADLLINEAVDVVDNNVEDVSNQIDDMNSYASNLPDDPYGQYIMNGLGKIASGLRAKGEGFAADVVETTAFSIREDLVKEAARKSNVTSSLEKLASEFRTKGDAFAADMVNVTLNNLGYK